MWWHSIRIKEIRILGIGPFKTEFTFYMNGSKSLVTGRNGSGKTFLLKSLEFFFNENKYLKTIQTHDLILDNTYIQVLFNYNGEEVWVRKHLTTTKSAVKVEKTLYSRDNYPIEILNFVELAFVYFFSSERLLTEKDNEFDFIQNSVRTKLLEESEGNVNEIDIKANKIIQRYMDNVLVELKDSLTIRHTVSLKTGLKVNLEWDVNPFKKLGSGQKKELALLTLYGFIKSRNKGPSILLIDNIETHFDSLSLQRHFSILHDLNNSHQIISTLSDTSLVMAKNKKYDISVIDKEESTNTSLSNLVFLDYLI